MIYILTIIMFFMGLCLCNIKDKSFSDCKIKFLRWVLISLSNDKYNEYFINIIIAVLGVTCAILLTNYDTNNKEIDQTIDLLYSLSFELATRDRYINENISVIIMDDEELLPIDRIKNTEFPPMISAETLLTDSPYQSTISNLCYNALQEYKTNMNTLQNSLNNAKVIKDVEEIFIKMSYELEYMKGVADLEILYQNKKIDYDDLYNEITELYNDIFSEENLYGIPSVKIYFDPIE